MKMYRKKRALTLLEIMIVIVLIGLIGSVIGFNMKGSLDEGRAFKTKQAQEQIKDILMLEVARGTPIEEVVEKRQKYLANSGLVKDPKGFLNDGWGKEFDVKVNGKTNSDIIVYSEKLKIHENKKREKLGKATINEAEEDDE
jgi:prepilin-type N-terminal cleavage/methylation domain-containing protein